MTRRGWYCLIALAVGLAPLAGCAQFRGGWGKSQDNKHLIQDGPPHDTAAASNEDQQEPKITTAQDAERVQSIAQKILKDQPPLPTTPLPTIKMPAEDAPPIVPVTGVEEPK